MSDFRVKSGKIYTYMEFGTVEYKSYHLEYYKYGNGPRIFIAFHGHGRHASDFKTFAEDLNATIYSFNLFFHGKSVYQQNKLKKFKPLQHEDLKNILSVIPEKIKADEYNFIAYSLGGKFTLNFITYFPEKVNQVILMAPDGLGHSFYSRSGHVPIFRWWFRRIVAQPKGFLRLTDFLVKIRLLSKGINKFLHYQMESPSRRLRAFLSWAYLRDIFPQHEIIKQNLKSHHIDLVLIMPENDQIIPLKSGEKFLKKMETGRLFKLESNHHIFRPTVVPEIKKMLCILAEQENHDEHKN